MEDRNARPEAPSRLISVAGTSKETLFQSLAEAAEQEIKKLEAGEVLEALWTREELLSTRLGDHVAMPHAQFPELDASAVIVALCPDGIEYDAHRNSPIHVAFCIVGDRADHLEVLSRVAGALQGSETVAQIVASAKRNESDRVEELMQEHGFISLATGAVTDVKRPEKHLARGQRLWRHALELAGAVGAQSILLHASPGKAKSFQVPPELQGEVFVISPEELGVPRHSATNRTAGGISISLLYALTEGRINQDDVVVAVYGSNDLEEIDTLQVTDVASAFSLFFSVSKELALEPTTQRVMLRVVEIAAELADEGREGKPSGALFVVGDLEAVRPHCQQMLMNPFKGYEPHDRNILDPGLTETVKELSRIDGAFIITSNGAIESAGTYLRVDADIPELPSGLGARHTAAASITAVSDAVAIAISESTRQVSIFRHGRRLVVL
ncbi:MAG: diadenylate cyclase [Spirochaetales bacterium]